MNQDLIAELTLRHSGSILWSARRGVGSYICLDFGGRHQERGIDGSIRQIGDLHIWVQNCAWKLTVGQMSATSDDADFEGVLRSIEGGSLVGISIERRSVSLTIELTPNVRLSLLADLRHYDSEDDLVSLFEFGRGSISLSPDRGVYRDQE